MKRFVPLIVLLSFAWPALVGAQEDPKPQEEREALRHQLSGDTQGLVTIVAAVQQEDPRGGVAGAWSAWLEENPDAVTDGTAARHAMIVANQGAEPTLREVDAYMELDPDENASVCSDGIDGVEDERDELGTALETPDADVDDLQDAAEEMAELSAALEACRAELASIVETAGATERTIPEPEKDAGAEAMPVPPARTDAAADEPDLDARSINEMVQRIETIDDWIERLDRLSEVTEDLHAETRSATDDAGA